MKKDPGLRSWSLVLGNEGDQAYAVEISKIISSMVSEEILAKKLGRPVEDSKGLSFIDRDVGRDERPGDVWGVESWAATRGIRNI